MILRFFSGSVTPLSSLREPLARVHRHQVQVEALAHHGDHALELALAEQAVVHEDADQSITERLVAEHGGHRGVDAAGKAANDAAFADLRTIRRRRFGDWNP